MKEKMPRIFTKASCAPNRIFSVHASSYPDDIRRLKGHADVHTVVFVRDTDEDSSITMSRMLDAMHVMRKLPHITCMVYSVRIPGMFGREVEAVVKRMKEYGLPLTLQVVADGGCFLDIARDVNGIWAYVSTYMARRRVTHQ